MQSVEELEQLLTTPSNDLIADMSHLSGDLLILGAGGKMGSTLAILARNALWATGSKAKVIAVSRFSDSSVREKLETVGVDVLLLICSTSGNWSKSMPRTSFTWWDTNSDRLVMSI